MHLVDACVQSDLQKRNKINKSRRQQYSYHTMLVCLSLMLCMFSSYQTFSVNRDTQHYAVAINVLGFSVKRIACLHATTS